MEGQLLLSCMKNIFLCLKKIGVLCNVFIPNSLVFKNILNCGCVCVHVCARKYRFLKRPEASDPPGAQIIDGCELCGVGLGTKPGPL